MLVVLLARLVDIPTLGHFDELWGFTSQNAERLWDELQPVPSVKLSARFVTTHAGWEGESDLLYRLYQDGLKQPLVGKDLHAGDGTLMFWSHEPLSKQQARFLDQARRNTSPSQYARMWENRFVSSMANSSS